MTFDALDALKVVNKAGGTGDVALGSDAVNAPDKKLFYITLAPKKKDSDADGAVSGMVFFNIAETGAVKKLLDKRIVSAKT